MSISNYAELKILDHLTSTTSWTMPADAFLKLHLADAGEAGTTSAAANTTRQAVAFAAAASGAIASSATVTWTSVSTTETYSHWSMWDDVSAGNCLWTGALSSSAAVTAGDTFQITALTLSLD